MAHAQPFTRRGPPTEEEERDALRQRRARSRARRAAELPPARSIPRTPFDPAHPTINPPGGRDPQPVHPTINPPRGAPGPRTQAELTAADEARKQSFAQDPAARAARDARIADRREHGADIRQQRREVEEFNRQEDQRRAQEKRRERGLPPLANERRETIQVAAARAALLDDDLEGIPRLQGAPEQIIARVKADPRLMDHGQHVRSGDKVLRYNAFDQTFTPVRKNPITGDIEIDTSDVEALSDANIERAYTDGITTLEKALTTALPDSAGQLHIAIGQLKALQGALGSLPRKERLAQFNKIMSAAQDDFNTKDPRPAVDDAVTNRVRFREDGSPEFILQPKDAPPLQFIAPPKPEAAEPPPPTTPQEFFRQGDAKQQQTTFFNVRKQAIVDLEAEAKRELDKEKAEFAAQATVTFNKKVAAAGKKEVDAIKAAGPKLFAGPETPDAPKPQDIKRRMEEIVQEFLDLRGPAPTAADTGFSDDTLSAIAAENDMTVDEFRRRFLPP